MRVDSWTAERIGLLKTLRAAGASGQAIADQLGGVSRSAVLGKLFRLRLRAPSRKKRLSAKPNGADFSSTPEPKRGKSLLELTNETCRWPHGRPGSERFHFCGAPGADLDRGMPYCARHARRAYPDHPGIGAKNKPAAAGAGQPIASPARPQSCNWRALVRHPAARSR